MRAEIELTHDDVIRAVRRYVISEFPTVVPIEEIRVNIQINNMYADNALYDSRYSARVTFGMNKVKPLGGND